MLDRPELANVTPLPHAELRRVVNHGPAISVDSVELLLANGDVVALIHAEQPPRGYGRRTAVIQPNGIPFRNSRSSASWPAVPVQFGALAADGAKAPRTETFPIRFRRDTTRLLTAPDRVGAHVGRFVLNDAHIKAGRNGGKPLPIQR